ncbi:YhcN/YlaJ family sporulation lipoprotein [Evansella tamaricis]|uniref:YhcN/YlaJ family sporulation lipoprotein n=1 Tax=Evansella tamaricis TaxID=2069301 RepID=A0ABS6JG00_9BACI|nr:YhcN/YlaJ family sporulation lipoprotein [Evansella tamaricis]MBU9711263.1 YhcN/YlaJ family sporulation lipoprotein [Evansella tamaricis]
MNLKTLWILTVILFVTACQGPDNTQDQNIVEGQMYGQGQSTHTPEEVSPNEIANHLANLSTRVPDVDHATAVVIGPYAVVGINVNGQIDQSDVGSIKYQVAERLSNDPYGASAAVTADPDIVERLDEMRDEMADGRPLNGMATELAAIIGRIMPIVPGYEHRQQEDPTDTNNDRMASEEEEQLGDIQEEQSKGRMNGQNNHNKNRMEGDLEEPRPERDQ